MSNRAVLALPIGNPSVTHDNRTEVLIEAEPLKLSPPETEPRLFKPDRLVIALHPRWTIRSIVIGVNEQLDQPLAGDYFSPSRIGGHPWLDAIREGTAVQIRAEYNCSEKGAFTGALFGNYVPPVDPPFSYSGPIRFRELNGDPIAAENLTDHPLLLPGHSHTFKARPKCTALRINHITIDLDADQWAVSDMTVNGRSQLYTGSPIPGEIFAPGVLGIGIHLDTLQTGMYFSITAAYQGPSERGRLFGVTCHCHVVR